MIAAKIGVVIAVAITAATNVAAAPTASLSSATATPMPPSSRPNTNETTSSARIVTIISSRIDQKRPDTSSNERPNEPNTPIRSNSSAGTASDRNVTSTRPG